MKKIFLSIILGILIITLSGCQKYDEKSIKDDLNNDINKIKGYHVIGDLEVYNGDNIYKYDVESSKYEDKYKVSLINKNNKHEQIIIKNDDGVYVLTPQINKSYKFQSKWPENSSQIYLLESLISDMNNDNDMKLITKNDEYIVETKLAYSNSKNLVKEKIYLNKKLDIKMVEVFDEDDKLQMKMNYNEIDKKATFNDNYFDVKENSNNKEEKTKETISEIEDTIYPMYLPSGTYLATEESVAKENGERVILTFQGESPFILVQETVDINDEVEDIPVNGEPEFIVDTIGAVSSSSVSFISNGVEYYLSSSSLTEEEMIQVAESMSPIAVMK